MAASPALWPVADASRLAVPVWIQPLSVLPTIPRLSTLAEEKLNEMKKKIISRLHFTDSRLHSPGTASPTQVTLAFFAKVLLFLSL